MKNKKKNNHYEAIKLEVEDFEKIFDGKLSDYVKGKIIEYNFVYSELTNDEWNQCIKINVQSLIDPDLISSGKDRISQWESGWEENLREYKMQSKIGTIIPKYFGKYKYVRFKQKFIKIKSKNFEYFSLKIILDWLFDKYFRGVSSVYEFGCGTGHNLLQAASINPDAKLWGLDWTESSMRLLKKISTTNNLEISNKQFDFFNPDKNFKIMPNSAIYTVAALEQVGSNYHDFVNYLLVQKPDYCIHVEPIEELLDENNLIDWLSIQYFNKRNYLKGFLNHLQELEKKGKVEILKAQRSYIGSLFIDGYSILVWKPL